MIKTFYKRFVFTSSGIALTLMIIYFSVDLIFNDYQSEFITRDLIYAATFFMALMNALNIGTLSLTMLLNHFDVIRYNAMFSALTWFLAPMIWITIILFKQNFDLVDFSKGLESEAILNIINTLPYINVSVFCTLSFVKLFQ